MAILQIKSTNKDLSWILEKNPETGLLIKELRQGKCLAWFSDNQTYNIYFKDGNDEVSFKQYVDEEFEYQNVSRYNHSLFANNAIKLFLDSVFKKKHIKDIEGFEHQCLINLIEVKRVKYLEMLKEHFINYNIEYKEVGVKNYRINISTNKGIHELINFVNLFVMFVTITNNNSDLWIQNQDIEKYLKCLNIVDAPYFVRYLFKLQFIKEKKAFDKYKEILEKTDRYSVELQYGNTGMMRKGFVQQNLSFNRDIIDVGCGDGFYAFSFAKKLKEHELEYHAIDVNEEIISSLNKKIEFKEIDNLYTYNNLKTFIETTYNKEKQYDIIMIEVIEHMQLSEAKELIEYVLKNINFNKIIISTPNVSFNKFYSEQDEMRHEDHKFELTKKEFEEFILSFAKEYKTEFVDIGDKVDNVSPTQGVIVLK